MSALVTTSSRIANGGFEIVSFNSSVSADLQLTANIRLVCLPTTSVSNLRIGSPLTSGVLGAAAEESIAMFGQQGISKTPVLLSIDVTIANNLKYVDCVYETVVAETVYRTVVTETGESETGESETGESETGNDDAVVGSAQTSYSQSQSTGSVSGTKTFTIPRYFWSENGWQVKDVTYSYNWRVQYLITTFSASSTGGWPNVDSARLNTIYSRGPAPGLGTIKYVTRGFTKDSNGKTTYTAQSGLTVTHD